MQRSLIWMYPRDHHDVTNSILTLSLGSNLRPFTSASRLLMAAMAASGADDPRQLWVGNIPQSLDEDEVLECLSMYGVRPYKLILRKREMAGKDSFGIAYFRSEELAAYAVTRRVTFWNGSVARFRFGAL